MNPQQKLALANAALILYYILPNLSSLILTATLVVLLCCPQCTASDICKQTKS